MCRILRVTICIGICLAFELLTDTESLAIPVTSGLIGHWEFDGDGADSSGNGLDVTLNGHLGFAPGRFGQALNLTSDNNKFAVRPVDDADFDFGSSDFTIQAWVNYNNTLDEQVIMEKWTTDSGPGWTLTKLGNNRYRFHANSVPGFIDPVLNASRLLITTGDWHHILVRRIGTNFDLFFDSFIVGSMNSTVTIDDVNSPLLFGKRNDGDGRRFEMHGLLDEVAIWNRGLTDSEVYLLFAGPPSDLTNNGFVDFEDLTVLLNNWNQNDTASEGNLVDPTNTPVNFEDLTALLADWTGPAPGGSPEAAAGVAGVPEPSTLVLALLAMIGLSVCRLRRAKKT